MPAEEPIYTNSTHVVRLVDLKVNKAPYVALGGGDSINVRLYSNKTHQLIDGPIAATHVANSGGTWEAIVPTGATPTGVHVHWDLVINGRPVKLYDYFTVEERAI